MSDKWFIYREGVAYIDLPQYAIFSFLKLELDMIADVSGHAHIDIPDTIEKNKDFRSDRLEKCISGFYNVSIRPDIQHVAYFDEDLDPEIQTGFLRLSFHESFVSHYTKNLFSQVEGTYTYV